MNATLPAHVLPRIDLVYTKTATGRQEVEQRSAALNARQRAALIMLDGQRDATALTRLMPVAEATTVLAALLALGLIAAPAAVAAVPVPVPQPAALAAIKADLISAAEAHLGVMASDIVARVRQADDASQLLRLLGRWHMAMQESRHGRDVASSLLDKTRTTLQQAA